MSLHEFDPPDRFVAGTVGQPGDRSFCLQASGGGGTVAVALEWPWRTSRRVGTPALYGRSLAPAARDVVE
jgi:hypothetical protein